MDPEEFLGNAFSWHYSRSRLVPPPSVEKREFGIGSFGKKISNRHLSFASDKALNDYLASEAPLFISYSCAYYERPSAMPMPAKGFLGSDLVYEFDADDFNSDCAQRHDSWKCQKCGASGKGSLSNCPECGGSASVDQWVCDECLSKARDYTSRLVRVLEDDFGVGEGEISINFSGSKGFHVHVRSENVKNLNSSARAELVDYLTGSRINYAALGFDFSNGTCPKPASAKGWAKKILDCIVDIFSSGSAQGIADAGGVSLRVSKGIAEKSELALKELNMGLLFSVNRDKKKSEKFWKNAVEFVREKESFPVDRQTSIDIRKIVRLPDSLHGSTGLKASVVPTGSLKSFDALKDSIVFSDKPVRVKTGVIFPFSLNKKTFGPFENEEAELPMYSGIYLVARGSAVPI